MITRRLREDLEDGRSTWIDDIKTNNKIEKINIQDTRDELLPPALAALLRGRGLGHGLLALLLELGGARARVFDLYFEGRGRFGCGRGELDTRLRRTAHDRAKRRAQHGLDECGAVLR